eukprot:8575053-Lingulodinium_polyedra.AAC.1
MAELTETQRGDAYFCSIPRRSGARWSEECTHSPEGIQTECLTNRENNGPLATTAQNNLGLDGRNGCSKLKLERLM